jgi:uncharacterized membrane protein
VVKLSIRKLDVPDGAEQAGQVVLQLQGLTLVVEDAAMVTPQGRPELLIGLALGAAAALGARASGRMGVSDDLLTAVRDRITARTSAPFPPTPATIVDRLHKAFAGLHAHLPATLTS